MPQIVPHKFCLADTFACRRAQFPRRTHTQSTIPVHKGEVKHSYAVELLLRCRVWRRICLQTKGTSTSVSLDILNMITNAQKMHNKVFKLPQQQIYKGSAWGELRLATAHDEPQPAANTQESDKKQLPIHKKATQKNH